MRRLLRRLLPQRIAAQTAAVVVGSVVLIHLAIAAHFRLLTTRAELQHRDYVQLDAMVRLVAAQPAGRERAAFVVGIGRAHPSLDVALTTTRPLGISRLREGAVDRFAPPPFADTGPGVKVIEIARRAGSPTSVGSRSGSRPPGPRRFAFGLDGGEWFEATDVGPPPPPFFFGPLGTSLIFAGLSSVLLGLWAAWGLVGPLRALAKAAREFDLEGEAKPLPKHGPEEVRVAASAFEAMRRRTRSLLEDRMRMLAAMGHDLRTPITRLRLRSEFVTDDALRAEIQRDLAGMNAMIEGALTYLSDGRRDEVPGLVDLSATIQTICDSWVDLGSDVVYDGPDHLVRRLRPIAIRRAVSNLVDNALKYGTRCRVRLRAGPAGGTVIEVEDDGPGIAAADRDSMLRPFVRGDAARNMDDHGGFGLGLAIVASVVERHRGRLTLGDARPHGLVVRIDLPGPPDKARPGPLRPGASGRPGGRPQAEPAAFRPIQRGGEQRVGGAVGVEVAPAAGDQRAG